MLCREPVYLFTHQLIMNCEDKQYMKMALKLAKRGLGSVEPNPTVGCVIVKNNTIIGKGYHKKFGGPHAEINALADCKANKKSPKGATMYATLEPCCHKGKTGPCTDAIIKAGLKKVIIAAGDPSKHANGKGVRKLRKAGIETEVGLCQKQAQLLNPAFEKFARTGKCWVTLKWAQSKDGKLAYKSKKQQWISCQKSRKDVHKLRRQAQAILVGINTVLADDPLLTPRPARGKTLTRIVLDNRLRIPLDCRLLQTTDEQPVIIFTTKAALLKKPRKKEKITAAGAKILTYPAKQKSRLKFVVSRLSKLGIAHLLVEGGAKVLASFIEENLADEFCVYIAPKSLGQNGSSDIFKAFDIESDTSLFYKETKRFGTDIRVRAFTKPV